MARFLSSAIVLFLMIGPVQAQDIYVQVEIEGNIEGCSILLVESDGSLIEWASNADIQAATGETECDPDDTGLAVSADGTVYFTEDTSHDVLQIAPDGTISVLVDSATLDALIGTSADADNGLAVAPDGNIYVADEDCNCVIQITPAGAASVFVTEAAILAATGKPDADLQGGLTFNDDGTMYFVDQGTFLPRAGEDDDADDRGNSGEDNDRVIAVSPGGMVSVLTTEVQILGILPPGPTDTDLDVDIAFSNDTLYVLNDGDSALIAINPTTGTPSLVADGPTVVAGIGIDNTDGEFDPEGGLGFDPSNGTLLIGTDGTDNTDDEDKAIIARVSRAGGVSVAVSDEQVTSFYEGLYGPNNDFRFRGGLDVFGGELPEARGVPTLSPLAMTLLALMVLGIAAVTRPRG